MGPTRSSSVTIRSHLSHTDFDKTALTSRIDRNHIEVMTIENGHVVPSLIRKFYEAKQYNHSVTVWGDGSAQRDFLYVKDAARAVLGIMEKISGPVNIGSGRILKIRDIVDMLQKISGLVDKVVWDSSRPNGQEYRAYDLSKLAEIKFQANYTI